MNNDPVILYEDGDLWICRKPAGMLTEAADGNGLADLLAARNGGYAGVIHRLDREVSGVTVWAKTPESAARLSALVAGHRLGKEYLAAVAGIPDGPEGELRDLLYYDRAKNKVFPVRRMRGGVREAILRYRVAKTLTLPGIGTVSLVRVEPLTGRTHQIRVQFASRGHAVIGDRRYGGAALPEGLPKGQILLSCRAITIPGPDGDRTFCEDPDWLRFVDPVSGS